MRLQIYCLTSNRWSDINTLNNDYSLKKCKSVLREELVLSSINRLKNYVNNGENHSIPLLIGVCTRLKVKGNDDAIKTIQELEYALENYRLP